MAKLVGILNITPDSFSDGNLFLEPAAALRQAKKLFSAGASMVDIGAESTRPGAKALSAEAEWRRLEPVLTPLLELYPGKLSVDTYHPETAAKALALGEVIINDVTGVNNPAMVTVIARHKARCVIGHLPGKASDAQAAHQGQLIDDVRIVKNDLLAAAELLRKNSLEQGQIILDPGIGFGKTAKLNQKLLKFAREVPDYQVMVGYSRKRFLGEQRMELAPNLAAGRIAIKAGATYLRVHDVAGHRQLL